MYLRAIPSTTFDLENYSVEDVANQIRELIKAITTPNFNKEMLNPAVYDPTASTILDGNYNGWIFSTSTRDAATLGSGAGLSQVGDIWVVTKGSKNIEFSIIHRPHLGENIRIAISPAVGADHEYWLDPRNHVTIGTSNDNSLVISEFIRSRVKTF